MIAYAYVGPEDIGEAVRPGGGGARIRTPADLDAFLSARPADELAEPFTFVVDASLTLRLAPRRSEHVACADGKPVRAAGELGFARTSSGWAVTYASNQSTGYCPDPASWQSVAAALTRAGIFRAGCPHRRLHPPDRLPPLPVLRRVELRTGRPFRLCPLRRRPPGRPPHRPHGSRAPRRRGGQFGQDHGPR